MSAILTVEFRVPAKYAEISREIIIETLKEKLAQLERVKEADMDWVEFIALRDTIENINHKIEVLRTIIEQNKA